MTSTYLLLPQAPGPPSATLPAAPPSSALGLATPGSGPPASNEETCSSVDRGAERARASTPSEEILAIWNHAGPHREPLAPQLFPAVAPDPVRQWHPPILLPSTMRALQQQLAPAAAAAVQPARLRCARRRSQRLSALLATLAHPAPLVPEAALVAPDPAAPVLPVVPDHPAPAAVAGQHQDWRLRPFGAAAPAA